MNYERFLLRTICISSFLILAAAGVTSCEESEIKAIVEELEVKELDNTTCPVRVHEIHPYTGAAITTCYWY